MNRRVYTGEPLPVGGGVVTVDGPEAHHLLHVLRAKAGDGVTVFDGRGSEAGGTVAVTRRQAVTVETGPPIEAPGLPSRPVLIGCPLPKGDTRQRWLVEKLTELGVTTFIPVHTAREAFATEKDRSERLLRASIEACKQCRRNTLLEIARPLAWTELLQVVDETAARAVLHPYPVNSSGDADGPDILPTHHPTPGLREVLWDIATRTGPIAWGIGPEGGLTDEEVLAATAIGWLSVALGPRILRMETACEVVAAVSLMIEVCGPPPRRPDPSDDHGPAAQN